MLVGLAAILAWVNDRFRLIPTSMGVMFGAIIISIVLISTNGLFGLISREWIMQFVAGIGFSDLLLTSPKNSDAQGSGALLGLLLFATALRIEPTIFTRFRIGSIVWLASAGVIITAAGTALLLMLVIWACTGEMPDYRYMLLFGAILAPTDPVAVTDLLAKAGVTSRVRDVIGGEALVNDASSIILYLFVITFLPGSATKLTTSDLLFELLQAVFGGLAIGAIIGFMAILLIRTSRSGIVVVLISIAAALGACVITPVFSGSVPLATVTCGLIVGRTALVKAKYHTDDATNFWTVVEQVLTTIIFMLVGLELLIVNIDLLQHALWGLLAVPLLLIVRAGVVAIPWLFSKKAKDPAMSTEEAVLVTWCGLRGTVSLAMAVAIPSTLVSIHSGDSVRDIAILSTFIVVVVTLSGQGLTLPSIVNYLRRREARTAN